MSKKVERKEVQIGLLSGLMGEIRSASHLLFLFFSFLFFSFHFSSSLFLFSILFFSFLVPLCSGRDEIQDMRMLSEDFEVAGSPFNCSGPTHIIQQDGRVG